MMSDVENTVNDHDFFVEIFDTPRKDVEQHSMSKGCDKQQ